MQKEERREGVKEVEREGEKEREMKNVPSSDSLPK